jgi:hypothetical protein
LFLILYDFLFYVKAPQAKRVHFQIRGKSGGLEERAADIGIPAAALILGAQAG